MCGRRHERRRCRRSVFQLSDNSSFRTCASGSFDRTLGLGTRPLLRELHGSVVMSKGQPSDSLQEVQATEPEWPDILTQAAAYLRISEELLYQATIRQGLPVRYVGNRQLFSRRKLLEWVEEVGEFALTSGGRAAIRSGKLHS